MIFHSEVVTGDEIDFVTRASLKTAVRRLRDNPEVGKPLTRELAGCRSIRVEGSENRLVYRLVGDTVQIIAIGRRRDDAVYETATGRLDA